MSARLSLRTRGPFWLGVLAVAVFGLRALIPTGYMLAAIDGHAHLVPCPASAHMNHASAMHHAGHAATGAGPCPYALSAGASLVGAQQDPARPYYSLLLPTHPPAVITASSLPPPRYHAPRGPPSPS